MGSSEGPEAPNGPDADTNANANGTTLSILNYPPRKLAGPCLLHELVQTKSNLGLPALHSLSRNGDELRISYAELHRAAEGLAGRILQAVDPLETTPDFVVPLLMPQGPTLYIAILAILKAGGAFCPLQLDAPPERLQFIIDDVDAKAILISPDLAGKLAPHSDKFSVIAVPDDLLATPISNVRKFDARPVAPNDLAYVMYTSGSTGKPKGVGITHEAATQSLLAHEQHIPAFKRFLQFASPTFDVSVFEIFFPLFRGCTLVTCDRARLLDDLPGVIRRLDVDACELTPTVAGTLLRARENAPCLSLLLTIGEMLTQPVIREFGENSQMPGMLWGMYGPTEATIHCTLQPHFPQDSSPRNIGIPLDTVSCFVARLSDNHTSSEFQLAPLGEVGELVVGGHQLARGYFNREEQTSEVFIESPYGRLYRTGDKARISKAGTLECLGRVSDGQVKLRGQRIELSEIEHAAERMAACYSAVAMVLDNVSVVFCLVDQDAESSDVVSDIMHSCRAWLPSFMVPADAVVLDDFPKLPSGKVDRGKLRQTFLESRQQHGLGVCNNNEGDDELVAQLLRVVQGFLGSGITPTANLSTHGLDSLASIRMASNFRRNGIMLSTLDILEVTTVLDLVAKVRSMDEMAGVLPPHQPPANSHPLGDVELLSRVSANVASSRMAGGVDKVDRCTPLQASMLAETIAGRTAYFNTVELEFPTYCSPEDIHIFFNQLAYQNDMLRSGFVVDAGGFARVIYHGLQENQVMTVDEFTLASDAPVEEELLRPLRVQIQSTNGGRRRVLLRLHHALYDGWAMDIITRDLSALAEGQALQPRPSFDQVSRFINSITQEELDFSRSYWAQNLLTWQPTKPSSLRSHAPKVLSQESTTKRFNASMEQLSRASGQLGCHPQVLFQGAISWLWGSILGASDVVIGTVSSGRTTTLPDVEDIVGPCIVPFPLHVNFGAIKHVADLSRHIQASNRQAMRHGGLPLSDIREAANIDPGRPLYDVLLVYQQSLYSSDRNSRLVREVTHHDALGIKLLVEVEPTSSGFVCQATYHSDFATSSYIEVFTEQLDVLVQQIALYPEALVSDIPSFLTANLLSTYNPEPQSYTGQPDLATAFESVAALKPKEPAVMFMTSWNEGDGDMETISYADLNNLSNQLAWYFHDQGASHGNIIAVIMQKSILFYAAILGALKAGCSYLALLPSTPAARIRTIIDQSSVKMCLVDNVASLPVDTKLPIPTLNLDAVDVSRFSQKNLHRPLDGSRPAYVVYTSGTTGTPKGIIVTHANIMSNLDALSRIYPMDGCCRFLQLCSQAFDVSVFEIFFTWSAGACLCSGTNDTLFRDIELSIRTLDCTHLSLTPTVASLIFPENVPNVRFLVTAGEPMTWPVAKQWGDLLYQGYGPAETTNICSVKRMSKGDYINHLGLILPNTSVYVLSPESNDVVVPLGGIGEFCFGGDQVAAGYLNLPELTESKFVEHPCYGRMYRSGDMGRMLPDGSLMVFGRLDGQVKLRGQRIETAEVDAVIAASGLADSSTSIIVSRQPAQATNVQLASFYVPNGIGDLEFCALPSDVHALSSNDQLFELLRSRLPSYMVPAFLVPISSLPMTSSGKVDKRRMQSTFENLDQKHVESLAESSGRLADDAEWSGPERQVAAAVSQTLQVPLDTLSRWQPLTAVGLDSISAIAVTRALESVFGSRVGVASILQAPFIARLARLSAKDDGLDNTTAHGADLTFFSESTVKEVNEAFTSSGYAVEAVLPCTPLQEAMLSSTSNTSYSNRLVLRLKRQPTRFTECWEELVSRHDILRTCFITTPNVDHPIAQVVLRGWTAPWIPSTGASDDSSREIQKPLDGTIVLQKPPYTLQLQHQQGTHYFIFTCHHALYDGQSMYVLLREFETLLNGHTLPRPIPYKPFLFQALALPETTEDFWRRKFQAFSPPSKRLIAEEANQDRSTPSTPSILNFTKSLPIPLSKLRTLASSHGVSLLSTCQLAWALVLKTLQGSSDVCFGNVMSGRTLPLEGIEKLVAPCFNTVPVRVKVGPELLVIDMIKSLHQLNTDLMEYQFTPLRLVQKLVPASGRGLFDTILLLQPPQQKLDGLIWELVEDSGSMDIPLVCEMVPQPGKDGIDVSLQSQSQLLTAENLSTIFTSLATIFGHIVEHPGSSPESAATLPNHLQQSIWDIVPENAHVAQVDRDDAQRHKVDSLSYEEEDWLEVEEKIRAILSDLAQVPQHQIRRHTTIFQLGLDSINAVQVASLLRQNGLHVSTVDVLQCPSCFDLAQRSSDSVDRHSIPTSYQYDVAAFEREVGPELRRRLSSEHGIDRILPCTPVQCGMLAEFVRSGGNDYFNHMSFQCEDSISRRRLEEAWQDLVKTHAILRTGFVPIERHDTSFAMAQYSLSSGPCTAIENFSNDSKESFDASRWHREVARRCFENLHLPPWRVALRDSASELSMHICIHHALYDATSIQSLLSDLRMLLKGEQPEHPPSLDAALSAMIGSSQNDTEAKMFWEEHASAAVVNKFPTLTPLIEDSPGLLCTTSVSRIELLDLREAAQTGGVSIQAIIQAAWTRVLSAYIGEGSVVYGVVLSGRTLPETKEVSMPCITTVPVIATNYESNEQLLNHMMEYNNQVYSHQFTPLSKIQQWLGLPGARLFDTLLVYQKTSQEDESRVPWEKTHDEGKLDYPVSLEVEPVSQGQLTLRLIFRSDILPSEHATWLLRQFDAIMVDLALHPTGRRNKSWETHPDLFSITAPLDPEIPGEELLLHQFVESSARNTPGRAAVEFVSAFRGEVPLSRTWTFKELDDEGNKVARLLEVQKLPARGIVAVHFDKCPEALFAMLGILKAGYAFLALDPSAPVARKEFILQDSKAIALLTSTQGVELEVSRPVIEINQESLENTSPEPPDLTVPLLPSDTCYCLYTSGSTGTPKGCEITHENAVQAMRAFQRLFSGHWDRDSKWLQFASFHFDVSVLEQYWSWSVGMPLVVAPREIILDDLAATIRRLRITHIDLTPSLARLLDPKDVPTLCKGVFITGGESLKQEILDVWGPKGVIYNAYGPTEATIGVTMYQRVPQNGRASNIGRQFDNVGSYVFQPGTEIPVLRGAVGELCVSGKLVGKGYLNRPELTGERFPILHQFKERVYRTGDLVRLLHDGCFEFMGRADDQVKLRGQRLEIGEINHTIRTDVSGLRDAVTLVTKHPHVDKDLLVSFVTTSQDARSSGELRVFDDQQSTKIRLAAQKACRERLPGYMVPSYIFHVSFIPLSINNKADLKMLGRLFADLPQNRLHQAASVPTGQSSPVTASQKGLFAGVQRFSGLTYNDLSLSTSLFDVGVDSISSLRLSRILKEHGFATAHPATILRNPVLFDLAEALEQETNHDSGAVHEARQYMRAFDHQFRAHALQELALQDEEVEYAVPCTPLQGGLISSALAQQEESYFNTFQLQLSDDVSVPRLKDTWRHLLAQHAILRTRFVQTSAGYAQVAVRELQASVFRWKEFSNKHDETEPIIAEARSAWIARNNAAVCSPLEFLIISDETGRRLIINIFHGLYDGQSFDLMLRWVALEYTNVGDNSRLPPKFVDILPWGPLQDSDTSHAFWKEHLKNCLFDPIPRQMRDPNSSTISLSRNLPMANLETAQKKYNVTLQSIVLSIWSLVFGRHFSQTAAIGVVVSGRALEVDHVEDVIGPLFNTVPFHADLGRQSWRSLVDRCQSFSISTLQFQNVPLRNIQKWCNNGRDIFDSLFVLQVDTITDDVSRRLWTVEDNFTASSYPLTFEARLALDNQLQVHIVAEPGIADNTTLERVLDDFDHTIASLGSENIDDITDTRHLPDALDASSTDIQGPGNNPSHNDYPPPHLSHVLGSTFEWTSMAQRLRIEVAGLAKVSQDDVSETVTLFELGLDSIDMVSLSSRLKSRGIHITMAQLMRAQTIEDMTRYAQPVPNGTAQGDKPAFAKLKSQLWQMVEETGWNMSDVDTVLPPTYTQEAMMAGMIESGFDRYYNHDVLEIRKGSDISRLQEAWIRVIQRSPILRTTFVQLDDPRFKSTYCQVARKSSDMTIARRQLGSIEDIGEVVEFHRRRAADGNGESHLLQLTFVDIKGKAYLVFSIAHVLYDGWSLSLLHQDVEAAYDGLFTDRPDPEDILQQLLEEPTEQSREFWSQYLKGARPSLLPQTEDTGAAAPKTVEAKRNGAAAQEFCRKNSISLQALGQACWACVLATWIGSLDVSFGAVLSGRDTEEGQQLMFPTMNTVTVRLVLHGSANSFLRYIQDMMADIHQHQAFPLPRAHQEAGHIPGKLFDSIFLLQRQPDNSHGKTEENCRMVSAQGSAITDFPVCVELETAGSELIWRVAGIEAAASNPDELLGQLNLVLDRIIAAPADKLVRFKEDQASICGLPWVSMADDDMASSDGIITPSTADLPEAPGAHWLPTETTIRSVLSEVSGVPEASIGKESTAYHLGLDSVSIIKAVSLLKKRGVKIGVRALLLAPSITSAAKTASQDEISLDVIGHIGQMPTQIDSVQVLETAGLSKLDAETILPASPMQVYMMTTWQNTGGTIFYPEFRYTVQGEMDSNHVASAWETLVMSQPILRTCLIATGREDIPFAQVILKPDVRGPHRQIWGDVEGDHTQLTPSCRPLVRMSAVQLQSDTWQLYLNIHHSLYDGLSLPHIMGQFSDLLSGNTSIEPQSLSCWKSHLDGRHTDQATRARRGFWTEYLKGVPRTSAPSTAMASLSAHVNTARLSYLEQAAIGGLDNLKKTCSNAGIGLSSLLLAAVAETLYETRHQQPRSVMLGIYYANRQEEDVGLAMFPKLSLLPLLVWVDDESSVISIAKNIQRDLAEITSPVHSNVGLWEIKEWAGVEVDVFVNFLNLPDVPETGEVLNVVAGNSYFPGDVAVDDEDINAEVNAPWLQGNAVRGAIPDTVDVEASVNGNGLDIGIFGPAGKITAEEARGMIAGVAKAMMQVV